MIAHARSVLAGYKAPKYVVVTDALPKNPSGKILKRDLRAAHADVPLILAGDFNCGPDGPELRALQPVGAPLVDCWEAAGDGAGHTWLVANPFTPAELTRDDRFDYLFHWPADEQAARPRSARLFGARQLTGTMLSDHLGVVVDLG